MNNATKLKKLDHIAQNIMGWAKAEFYHYAYPYDISCHHPDDKITKTGKKDKQGRDIVRVKHVNKPDYVHDGDALCVFPGNGACGFKFDPFTDQSQAVDVLNAIGYGFESPCAILSGLKL